MIYELSKLDSSKIASMINEPNNQKDLAQLIYYLGRMKMDKDGKQNSFENDQDDSVIATL